MGPPTKPSTQHPNYLGINIFNCNLVTYSSLLGLELFLPLQPILLDLSLSFFLGLLQTPVLT